MVACMPLKKWRRTQTATYDVNECGVYIRKHTCMNPRITIQHSGPDVRPIACPPIRTLTNAHLEPSQVLTETCCLSCVVCRTLCLITLHCGSSPAKARLRGWVLLFVDKVPCHVRRAGGGLADPRGGVLHKVQRVDRHVSVGRVKWYGVEA